jgi:nicotinamide-nucleotide amidase
LFSPLFSRKIIDPIKNRLLKRNETISVAESVTSGLLQLAFSTAEKAMEFYQGGITAYNLGQKSRHLLVDPIHGISCNCVSEKIAADMALNVCKLFSSDWGIGITGFASPVPESGNKLFAYYAIAWHGAVIKAKKIEPGKNSPLNVQLMYARYLLKDFSMHLSSF